MSSYYVLNTALSIVHGKLHIILTKYTIIAPNKLKRKTSLTESELT